MLPQCTSMAARILFLLVTLPAFHFGSLPVIADDQAEPKIYPIISGVGIALSSKDGKLFAAKIISKSPAAESKQIVEGSRLVSVEIRGESISLDGKSVGEAASLIRGPVGTKIVLTVVVPDSDTEAKVTLTRKPLEIGLGMAGTSYQDFIGKVHPKLELSLLEDSSVKSLAEFRGRIIVVDFWASWCPTCYQPVAKLQKLSSDKPEWNGKVEFLTVTIDSEPANAAEVINQKKWGRTQNFSADPEMLSKLGISVVPLLMIIAPDGTVTNMAEAHSLDLEKEIEALLAK